MSKILELSNVSKHYEQGGSVIEIVRGVNLSVASGELVAIIGSSGSGKSTMLHIAGLLDKKFEGEVIIDGTSTKDAKDSICESLRLNHLGFIYQYHHLLKDFTARENVTMPQLIAGRDYSVALKESDELLKRLGLEKRLHNYPGEMSGGEQQRVAIARSLINNPKVVLADEPTGNLDSQTADMVLKLFLELARERGLAAIIVTHNREIAQRMDKVYEIKDGVLVRA